MAEFGSPSRVSEFLKGERDLSLEQAKRMLIEGFMEEILTEVRLSDENKEAIREQLFPILG